MSILVTLSLAILITSVIAVEIRSLRSTSYFYLFHSIFLCSIILSYAYHMNNPTLYLWALTCFITKIIIIPIILFHFVKRFPSQEYKPLMGHGISLFIIATLTVVFFKVFQSYTYLLAPGDIAKAEPDVSAPAVYRIPALAGIRIGNNRLKMPPAFTTSDRNAPKGTHCPSVPPLAVGNEFVCENSPKSGIPINAGIIYGHLIS